MELRGVRFPPISSAAGAAGFYSPKEYWYHRFGSPWKICGLTQKHMGRVAKTMTAQRNPGNMLMKGDGITPRNWLPPCILVRPFQGVTLNSVGLSNPGAPDLLRRNIWQQQPGPFRLSFMAPEKLGPVLDQVREFTDEMLSHAPHEWRSQIGIEVNISCPNIGKKSSHSIDLDQVGSSLDILGELKLPIQVKLSATVSVSDAKQIAAHRECDAITMSNTIPWGELANRIDWHRLFGTTVSPLENLGGGGLSGWPLQQIVLDWCTEALNCSFPKPVIACGGIDSSQAVLLFSNNPIVKEVQVGTAGMLYPWRMRRIIRTAHQLFS